MTLSARTADMVTTAAGRAAEAHIGHVDVPPKA